MPRGTQGGRRSGRRDGRHRRQLDVNLDGGRCASAGSRLTHETPALGAVSDRNSGADEQLLLLTELNESAIFIGRTSAHKDDFVDNPPRQAVPEWTENP